MPEKEFLQKMTNFTLTYDHVFQYKKYKNAEKESLKKITYGQNIF